MGKNVVRISGFNEFLPLSYSFVTVAHERLRIGWEYSRCKESMKTFQRVFKKITRECIADTLQIIHYK